MASPSGTPTYARRLAQLLARLGVDPGPAFQRARNLLLRPVRHELADARREVEPLHAALAALAQEVSEARRSAEATRGEIALQQQALAAASLLLDAQREQLDAQGSELAAQRQAFATRVDEIAAQRQALDAQAAEIGEARRQLAAQRARLEQAQQGSAQLRRESEQQAVSARATGVRLAALERDHAGRLQLLEQLLADSGLPRAPLPCSAPLVSIVMPTRDRAGCIGEAIASVLAQDYPHWQLHIVDDGSRDDTRAVMAPFLADPRISYEAIAHSGPSAARNHALRAARGDFVAYLDSDNLWFPGFLGAAVAALTNDPGTDLVYGALATDAHAPGGLSLLFEAFDRARLEHGNYIDLNVVVHRRSLCESHGCFDESLSRLVDWDLVLRYTAHAPARSLPILAARYRIRDTQRISDSVPVGPSWIEIRRRLDPPPAPARRPRVLYLLWHYPQLSETYVESEIRCLQRWGVDIAVWREVGAASPYDPSVPVHSGDLAKLVRDFQPDVLHVHWVGYALARGAQLGALGVPVTLRMHGFDVNQASLNALLDHDWVHRVYAYPHQLQLLDAPDRRALGLSAAFDTSLFRPAIRKDTRMVLRASACLPSKELTLFLEVAKRLPSHRFVLCCVTCNEWEHYADELRRLAAELASPVELRFDVPREEMVGLVARAGIFLHTAHPPHSPPGTPIGMPISIAEAMATGAYVLVRDLPELANYVGDGGATYRDAAHAAELIAASSRWSEAEWLHRSVRASDRAYLRFADETVLRPILADWQALAQRRVLAAGSLQAAGAA